MNYAPPLHIAVINLSRKADKDVAFWVAAARIYLGQIATAWGLRPPGIALYASEDGVTEPRVARIYIVDDDGNAGSYGYHTVVLSRAIGLAEVDGNPLPERTFLHEAGEIFLNWALDQWVLMPSGMEYAREINDFGQRHDYEIRASVGVQTRVVRAPNWATPEWFALEPWNGHGDHMRATAHPGHILPGGYQIAITPDDDVVYLAGPGGMAASSLMLNRRLKAVTLAAEKRIRERATTPRPEGNA